MKIAEYNWETTNNSQTYHELIEILKFAFAMKTNLADPDFVDNVPEASRKAGFSIGKINHVLISFR